MSSGCYRITNKINGKVYIGLSLNLETRLREHFKKTRRGASKLYRAMNKYGNENFIAEIIYVSFHRDSAHLTDVEEKLIAEYDSVNSGYNILPAAKGVICSQVCRERNRKRFLDPKERKKCGSPGEKNPMFGRSRKGEKIGGAVSPVFGEKNHMFGRSWYEGKDESKIAELKAKMSYGLLNRSPEDIAIWKEKLSNTFSGKKNPMHGTSFLWINNGKDVRRHDIAQEIPAGFAVGFLEKHTVQAQEARKRPVVCIDTGIVYESATSAAKDTGSDRSKITMCCLGNRKKTNGLHWAYAIEELKEAA